MFKKLKTGLILCTLFNVTVPVEVVIMGGYTEAVTENKNPPFIKPKNWPCCPSSQSDRLHSGLALWAIRPV